MNRIAGESSFSSINVTAPSSGLLFIYYGIMFLCTSEFFWICIRKKQIKKIGIISLLIFIFSISTPFIIGETGRKADIVFVDVGQGDCIHLRTPSGKNILVDGGGSREYDVGKNILLPYLLKNGVPKVDLALVTHLHVDHYKGIASLCHLIPVDKLGLYEANALRQAQILEETGLEKGDLIFLTKNHRISVEKDIWIDILYPEPQDWDKYEEMIADNADENRSSLLIRLYYKGITLLLTGDMGLEGEEALMDIYTKESSRFLKTDILKVGHHGSRYSTGDKFLEIIEPKIAVIQVGKNNFGHPHSDVIEKLENKDIMIFRTDRQGAVLLDIKEGNFRIRTMLSDK
jgi:competence protein ComEC